MVGREEPTCGERWRPAVAMLCGAAAIAVSAFLTSEWIEVGSKARTRSESYVATELYPPSIIFWANPLLMGSCGPVDVQCGFAHDYEISVASQLGFGKIRINSTESLLDIVAEVAKGPTSSAGNIPCGDAISVWTQSCPNELAGFVRKEPETACPGGGDCLERRIGMWLMNGSAASAIRFRAAADQLVFELQLMKPDECVAPPTDEYSYQSVSLYATHHTGAFANIDEMMACRSTAEFIVGSVQISRRLGTSFYLGLEHGITVGFQQHDEIDLDGNRKSHIDVRLSQVPFGETCIDRGPAAGIACNTTSCSTQMGKALCPMTCKQCEPQSLVRQPRMTIFVRPTTMTVQVTRWLPGQSLGELLGVIFGWVGIFTGISILSVYDSVSARLWPKKVVKKSKKARKPSEDDGRLVKTPQSSVRLDTAPRGHRSEDDAELTSTLSTSKRAGWIGGSI
eukprot:TRINITY_DN771_c0_g1_i2.p1 TRINITY_DN771_c0_g1~~TRINITY_DN771_c0_g1_i2.p1  ORF type:complete len:453 (+),score=87.08 TRINITY_DN771_c0_g1_i2:62-1420(+)